MILSSCPLPCARSGHQKNKPLCGMGGPNPGSKSAPAQSTAKTATAGSGNLPKARCCDFEPGTPKWRPVFLWPDASVPTVAPHQKSRSESTDQRLLVTLRLWSGSESMPDADILLRARQAEGRDLNRSPPVHRKKFVPAIPPKACRAAARPPGLKSSAHNPDTSSAAPPDARRPRAWHNGSNSRGDEDGSGSLAHSKGAPRWNSQLELGSKVKTRTNPQKQFQNDPGATKLVPRLNPPPSCSHHHELIRTVTLNKRPSDFRLPPSDFRLPPSDFRFLSSVFWFLSSAPRLSFILPPPWHCQNRGTPLPSIRCPTRPHPFLTLLTFI